MKASPDLVLRTASPEDTPAVMELTSTIWEGHDYVPHVWHEWLADPHGLIAVAELDGRLVGFTRLAKLSESEWWLQGLRVHPQYEGLRIASRLHDFIVAYWAEHHGGTVRFTTWRPQVIHLAERSGFKPLQEFSLFTTPALAEPVSSFTPLPPMHAPQALSYLQDSPAMALTAGLMTLGWEWIRPTQENLTSLANEGLVWRWQEQRGLLAAYKDTEEIEEGGEVEHLFIRLLACEYDDILPCLLDFRRLAAQQGFSRAGWVAPLVEPVLTALQAAGFTRAWDGFVHLFELTLPLK